MKSKIKLSILAVALLSVTLLFTNCKKEEGEGGKATIKGKVFAKYYNNSFSNLMATDYAPEEDVYIIYGDNESFNDRTRTNYDGTFEFNYLRPGKYTIYVYSKDSTQSIYTIPSGKYPVSSEVEIGKKDKEVELEDLVIFDNI
jgi:hypothetical protein